MLHLDGNRIGYRGMKAFAQCRGLKKLTTLNLMYNRIDPKGLELMKDSPRLQALEYVKTDLLTADD